MNDSKFLKRNIKNIIIGTLLTLCLIITIPTTIHTISANTVTVTRTKTSTEYETTTTSETIWKTRTSTETETSTETDTTTDSTTTSTTTKTDTEVTTSTTTTFIPTTTSTTTTITTTKDIEEKCSCACAKPASECDGYQCGKYPMPGCPWFEEDCDCGCREDIGECDHRAQCGSTPQEGCKIHLCWCGCNLMVSKCGQQCYDSPAGKCPKVEKMWTDYDQKKGYQNKKGNAILIFGLDAEGPRFGVDKDGKRTYQIGKFKWNPIAAKIPWKTPAGEGALEFGGMEINLELSTDGLKFGAQIYGAKIEQQDPGKNVKGTVSIFTAGAKVGLIPKAEWEVGTGLVGGGGSVNIPNALRNAGEALGIVEEEED